MTHEPELKCIYCPYCDTANFLEDSDITHIFPYPTITPPGKYLGPINNSLTPPGTQEKGIQCTHCGNQFSILIFTRNLNDSIYDNNVKNFLNTLLEHKKLDRLTPRFENFIKWILNIDFFDMRNRLFVAYLVILVPLLFFIVFQQFFLGSISLTLNDYPFLFFFIFFGLLFYLFGIFIDQYHSTFCIDNLPLLLSEKYRNSPSYEVFEEWKIHFFNYDYLKIPYTRLAISHPTFMGLLASGFYLILFTIYLNIGLPIVHSSLENLNIILSISYLPFWLFFLFSFGYISSMLLHTSDFIVHLSENTPLEFNPLKKNAGFDFLIKICSLIILQITIIGLLFTILIFDLWRMGFLQIQSQQMLNEPWGILIGIFIIIILMWIYIHPLIILIKRYQKLKNDYLEKIRKEIESDKVCSYYENQKSDNTLLLFKFNKANSLADWPLPIKVSLLISVSVSLLSLLGSILKILGYY